MCFLVFSCFCFCVLRLYTGFMEVTFIVVFGRVVIGWGGVLSRIGWSWVYFVFVVRIVLGFGGLF